MWGAGIIMYMLLFAGEHPFHDRGCVSKDRVRSGDVELGWFTSTLAADLVLWLLMPNPSQRIVPSDALQHAWFAGFLLGKGGLTKDRPGAKLMLDSHGNWLRAA